MANPGLHPASKNADGSWHAVNLTYYGFFNAAAYTLAVGLFYSDRLPAPAVHWHRCRHYCRSGDLHPRFPVYCHRRRGKRHNFTVGGAFFTGLLVAPTAILIVNVTIGERMCFDIPLAGHDGCDIHCLCPGRGCGQAGLHQLRLLLTGKALVCFSSCDQKNICPVAFCFFR